MPKEELAVHAFEPLTGAFPRGSTKLFPVQTRPARLLPLAGHKASHIENAFKETRKRKKIGLPAKLDVDELIGTS